MNRYQLLTEAEIDAKKNELLSQLSDEDLAMIVGELDEAEGGRFAFDPLKRQPASQDQRVQQQPKPAPTPQAQPKPQAKQEPKPQPKKVEPARKAEIKQTVDQLKPKEKAALVKAAKAELKKRETTPKDVKPAQPGTLKKVVKNLALAAVAATVIGGMFGGNNNTPSGADSTPQVTAVAQSNQQVDQKSVEDGMKWLLHLTNNSQNSEYDIKDPDKLFNNNTIKSVNVDRNGNGTIVGLVNGQNELTVELKDFKIDKAVYSLDYEYSDYVGSSSKLATYVIKAGEDLTRKFNETGFYKGEDIRSYATKVKKYVDTDKISTAGPDTAEPEVNVQPTSNVEPTPQPARTDGLSNFTIKNIRFGMGVSDLSKFVSPKYDKRWAYDVVTLSSLRPLTKDELIAKFEAEKNKTRLDYQKDQYDEYINILKDPEYKVALDSTYDTDDIFRELTIGGIGDWNAMWHDQQLHYIYKDISPSNYADFVDRLSSGYGEPTVRTERLVSNMGVQVVNIISTWQVNDATIVAIKYDGNITEGIIRIVGNDMQNNYNAERSAERSRSSSDF